MAPVLTLSKGRFEAFSDGVFAIAITLLVLEFHLPALAATPGVPLSVEQFHALVGIWPQYIVYVASFATIGIMWMNRHSLPRYIEKITYGIVLSLIAVGYNTLMWQVQASHPSIPRRPVLWVVIGLTAYPLATLIAYFAPVAGIALFFALMIFYLLPGNVASVAFKPE